MLHIKPQIIHDIDEYFKDFVVNLTSCCFRFVNSCLIRTKCKIALMKLVMRPGIHSIGERVITSLVAILLKFVTKTMNRRIYNNLLTTIPRHPDQIIKRSISHSKTKNGKQAEMNWVILPCNRITELKPNKTDTGNR